MNPVLISLALFYVLMACVANIFVSLRLEKRRQARSPATRPYRWGYYFGCLEVSCALLALLSFAELLSHTNGNVGALVATLFFAAHAVCGWFIIQRTRWAWVMGSLFSCNLVIMLINYAYGRKRWPELAGPNGSASGSEDEAYDLLHEASMLEADGHAQVALTIYQRVAEQYAHTGAARDAKASIEILKAHVD